MKALSAERDEMRVLASRLADRLQELEGKLEKRTPKATTSAASDFDDTLDLPEEEDEEPPEEDEEELGFLDQKDEIRVRRIDLDRERSDRELEQGEHTFWMICPKCGDGMEEYESENIKVERCDGCGGLYLDRAEVDLLLLLIREPGALRRVRNVLKD